MPVMRDQLRAILRPYGLEELADAAASRFVDGMPSASELELWLEEQPVVQREFSAVFERRKQGKPPISISDVVEYRRRAGELASYYDLPPGFVDVNKLLVNDVSVSELGDRVQAAADIAINGVAANPQILQAARQQYGLTSIGDVIAFALDPDSGLPAVQRRIAAVKVGAQAMRQGFGALTRAEGEQLVGSGVTEQQAQQGFDTLGRFSEVTKRLEGEADGAMSRQSQLGVVSGDQPATSDLEQRARKRKSVFDETGGLGVSSSGVLGAGVAR